jgi:hypothetical protein
MQDRYVKTERKIRIGIILILLCIMSCTQDLSDYEQLDSQAVIFPDYSDLTVPANIAPLNFIIREKGENYAVNISTAGYSFTVSSSDGKIRIPAGSWRKLMDSGKGKELNFEIFMRKEGRWFRFPVIRNRIAEEKADSYIVYRLIDPGFELWNRMGIYQRCIEDYSEEPVMVNTASGGNCMNCHSFSHNDSKTMMFHMRSEFGGTVIFRKGTLKKVDTKTDSTISSGVYPSWHPGGRYIAYSVNNIIQTFHSVSRHKTEVTDTLSDLVVYDTEKNLVFTGPSISRKESLETFPSWSPDGKYLYFCSAVKLPYTQSNKIRYDLLRVTFDEETASFGVPDTVVKASAEESSISFPRISPDGKYLVYCRIKSGNFSIWHQESDLYMKNLETGVISELPVNSSNSESYHSWSSDGRWIIFSSRRDDGLFTRLYFSYFDKAGNAHKPFLLPLKDPGAYDTFLKSYNVPEFVTTKVDLNPRKLREVVMSDPEKAVFMNPFTTKGTKEGHKGH